MNNSDQQWYYRSGGRESGPIATDELVDLARNGIISSNDELRVGPSTDWIQAGQIDALFSQHSKTSSQSNAKSSAHADSHDASGAAADVIADMHRRQLRQTLNHGAGSKSGTRSTRRGERNNSSLYDWMNGFGVQLEDIFRSLAEAVANLLMTKKALWTIGLSALVLIFVFLPYQRLFPPNPHTTCLEIWDQFKMLREQNASEATWEQFAQTSSNKLNVVAENLEKRAAVDDPVSLELLWASRDYLPQMLKDARVTVSPAETQLEQSMNKIDRIYTRQKRQGNSNSAESASLVTTIIIIFDVLLVLGVVGFLIRKKSAA